MNTWLGTLRARGLGRAAALWQSHTWPARVGAVMLALGLAWVLLLGPVRQNTLHALRDQVAAQRRAALQASASKAAGRAVSVAPGEAFQSAFPTLADREARVMSLWHIARDHGIEPLRSEFRLSDEAELGLMRYRISWPVSGTYAQVRGLIDTALAADRALSLDTLVLTRNDEQPGQLKAEIVWSLWMRGTTQRPGTGAKR